MKTPVLLFALLLAVLLTTTACDTCDTPVGADPAANAPDLYYTFYQRNVAPRIYTAKADGSAQRPWQTTSGHLTQTGLMMSKPQNGKVAFIDGGEREPVNLIVADLNGANAKIVARGLEWDNALYPVLAPDASKVAVTSEDSIIVFDVASGSATTVATDIQRESRVFFRPVVGEIVYYTSSNSIKAVRTDGSNARTLVSDAYSNNDYSCFLDFSPDGGRMVYMKSEDGGDRVSLAILNLATQQNSMFVADPSTTYAQPSWSADGSRIAFVRGTSPFSGTTLAYAAVNTPGQEIVVHEQASSFAQWPSWSATGTHLVATITLGSSPDNGTYTVRTFDVQKGTSTLIGTDLVTAFWAE